VHVCLEAGVIFGRSGRSANKWFYSEVKFVMEGRAMGIDECVQKRAQKCVINRRFFPPFLS
jgi:hypothetical protein